MRLYIVRHGESIGNKCHVIQGQLPYGLTELGIKQAHFLARYIQKLTICRLFSSDLPRALETAKIIQGYLDNMPIEITKLLRERSYGDLEGATTGNTELSQPFGGECLSEFFSRVRKALDMIIQSTDAENALVVSHGGTISAMVSILLDLEFDSVYRMKDVANGSITVFDPLPSLVVYSDTRHLDASD